jgi:hypothetical protein
MTSLNWKFIDIRDIRVNGMKIPGGFEIQAPEGRLFMVTRDENGKTLAEVEFPTKEPS